MKDVILVVDTGSSSMRGILFDRAGNRRFQVQRTYTMSVGEDGSAVMEADIFTECLEAIAAAAAEEIREKNYRLLAVSLDSQRSSVLALDAERRPLHPILMWYDKRCAPLCTAMPPEKLETIYRLCGMRLTPVSSAPKMLWLKRNLTQVYQAADKLVGIHDYLLYQMTGLLVTDASCACRSALMDIHTFDYSQELLSIFQIDREKLCPILRPGSPVGLVTEEFAARTGMDRVPVISGGGDQQCCILGQQLESQGRVSVNSGSASYLSLPVAVPVLDKAMEVNLSAFYGEHPWVLEASNMGSGTVYQWFNRIFYHEKDTQQINAEVLSEPPGSRGLICFPDFAGRGCPETDPDARGMFWNVGLQHTRASFARAVLEGICFDIWECVCQMQSLGVPVTHIQSTGGLSRFGEFNQILADISGMEVRVSGQWETTAFGAFLAACRALEISVAPVPIELTTYVPNEQNYQLYQKIMVQRRKMREKLEKW